LRCLTSTNPTFLIPVGACGTIGAFALDPRFLLENEVLVTPDPLVGRLDRVGTGWDEREILTSCFVSRWVGLLTASRGIAGKMESSCSSSCGRVLFDISEKGVFPLIPYLMVNVSFLIDVIVFLIICIEVELPVTTKVIVLLLSISTRWTVKKASNCWMLTVIARKRYIKPIL
jgi:hypothetical protein